MEQLLEEFNTILQKRKQSTGTTFHVVDNFTKSKILRRIRVPKLGIPHDIIIGNGAYRNDGLIYVVDDFETDTVLKILNPNK